MRIPHYRDSSAPGTHTRSHKTHNCCCTVCDKCESSTTESRGNSDVNSSSKFDVSIALALIDIMSSRSRNLQGTHNSRLVRRRDCLLPQLLPIDMSGEEWMVFDILGTADA